MKLRTVDLRLVFGLVLAHLLLFFSFQERTIFWYFFSASILLLIAYASFQGEADDEKSFFTYIFLGVISGLLLYGVFWIGYKGIQIFHLPFENHISRLYRWYAPSIFWQFLALILVAAPGEEIFWRGFIQKRLMKHFSPLISILLGAFLYASVQLYSGEMLLVAAAFLTGLVWGGLYFWKKSMPLVIVSHLIFDILLFILIPIK
ncbi:CPBP family intramembrane glutamic endopeptidase [Bacillota bacterium Lsc_1132]